MKLRKKLAKVIAIMAIGAMSISTFASESQTTLPVLTLEQAVSSALSADAAQMEAYEKSIASSNQIMMDTDDVGTGTYQSTYYSKLKTEQTIKYHKDAVSYQTTKMYNEIALLEQQLAFYDKKLPMQEKIFSQTQLKYNKGLVSKLEYEKAASTIEEQRTAKEKLQAQLDSTRADFRQLAQYDTKNYSLEKNFDVEYYEYTGNIYNFFNSTVDEMLEYDKKLAEVADQYVFSDMIKRRDNSATSYYSGKASAAQSKNAVEKSKEGYLSTLNSLYTSLQTTKQSIKELEVTIEDLRKTLAANKLKFEKGLISQIQIEQDELTLEEQELNLIKLKVNYNSIKEAVRKPWVSFY